MGHKLLFYFACLHLALQFDPAQRCWTTILQGPQFWLFFARKEISLCNSTLSFTVRFGRKWEGESWYIDGRAQEFRFRLLCVLARNSVTTSARFNYWKSKIVHSQSHNEQRKSRRAMDETFPELFHKKREKSNGAC